MVGGGGGVEVISRGLITGIGKKALPTKLKPAVRLFYQCSAMRLD